MTGYTRLIDWVKDATKEDRPIRIAAYNGFNFSDCPLKNTYGLIVAIGNGNNFTNGILVLSIPNSSTAIKKNLITSTGVWVSPDWTDL